MWEIVVKKGISQNAQPSEVVAKEIEEDGTHISSRLVPNLLPPSNASRW